MGSARRVSLDVLRVAAIVSVLICHGNKTGLVAAFATPMRVIGQLGVPLFALLTGYLMLGRDYSSKGYIDRFLRRNLLPMFVAFELWNIIWWALGNVIPMADAVDLGGAIKIAFFARDTGSAMWYMHMVLAAYLGMPILSAVLRWLQDDSRAGYRRVLMVALLWFGLGIPTLQQILRAIGSDISIKPVVDMNLFGASVWGGSVWAVYFILGLLIRRGKFDGVSTRMTLVTLLTSLVLCGVICQSQMMNESYSIAYGSLFVATPAVCLFILVDRAETWFSKKPDIFVHAVMSIASSSFSIYMIHVWVLNAANPLLNSMGVGAAVIFAFDIVGVGIISYFIARVLGLSKVLRKWLLLA